MFETETQDVKICQVPQVFLNFSKKIIHTSELHFSRISRMSVDPLFGFSFTTTDSEPVEIRKLYQAQRRIHGGRLGRSLLPKTYESNFIHHDFVQFGKQQIKTNFKWVLRHIRIVLLFAIQGHSVVHCFVTAVLWSIHLSCSREAVMRLDYQILLKSPEPLRLLAVSTPDQAAYRWIQNNRLETETCNFHQDETHINGPWNAFRDQDEISRLYQ